MKKTVILFISFVVVIPLYGFNSLVRHEDIPKMRELGINKAVIHYFISHQTSSLSSEDVIKMKQSGLNNDEIMSAIKSNLYRPERKSTAMQEAELIVKLKESGMSDEAVLQFIKTVKSTRQVDSNGNLIQKYTNEFQRTPYPTKGATFPKPENYGYDPLSNRFLLYVTPQNSQ
jgi:DNA-binding transcriptional regulator YhcF (GntR family)